MAAAAGHDINYVAMSGLLSTFGPANSKPSWPHNLVADFAGGGLMCAFGVLAALMHRQNTGIGQIIDVSMTHGRLFDICVWLMFLVCRRSHMSFVGAAYVGSFVNLMRDNGFWSFPRGQGLLDGGRLPLKICTMSPVFSHASWGVIRSALLHHIHLFRWRFGGCWCHRGTGFHYLTGLSY